MTSYSDEENAKFVALYRGSLIPLHAVLVGLTWIVHDYFVTLEDEVRYVWPQKMCFSKAMFLWIRYYSIALLIFDVTQIHVFSIPGITGDNLCVAMDSIIRVVGAVSLWSVEIVLQLRIYALYKCSKKVALINAVLFAGSIAGFFYILVFNAQRRHAVIADAIHLPLPGCPSIHSGIEWVQWVPATAYEGVLFAFALYKTSMSTAGRMKKGKKISLYSLILRDNIFYFLAITVLLVFNNLMVVGVTKIPWFSYGPFHAAIGVLTTRMLLNLRKASATEMISSGPLPSRTPLPNFRSEVLSWHAAAGQGSQSTADFAPSLSLGSTGESTAESWQTGNLPPLHFTSFALPDAFNEKTGKP